ncbi:putative mitochondrial hypothetical protein [Leptomonas pyrrhocoris]|uniref:Uncharacterized protein n=1 Tax=Leptomonas pyrrhocoris TaxID=157538 RepID=A0A0N0DYN5_LEPPY|nr:putative mitochondrial hypothetical protein [Leptomonas pyrrhocoris]KPA84368.1 putative mitochondrial hypothetical protein [Leptomonas pyrrhocoris]|eukprot:XP_015662807.1 putative mitochondrial hypothetical protein [Leptomonas pyrrhocoris]
MSSTQAAVGKKSGGVFQRFVVAPCANTAHKIEHRSATKLQRVEPAVAAWIKTHESTGADAAAMSTKRFLHEQQQLLSYRVVRFFDEVRFLGSGQYFKQYNFACFLQDARFFTQALFIFLCAVLVGRRSIFAPIHPDSPLAIALDHKVNPNY